MLSAGGGNGKGVALGDLETGLYLLFKLRMRPVPTNIWESVLPRKRIRKFGWQRQCRLLQTKNNDLNQDKSVSVLV